MSNYTKKYIFKIVFVLALSCTMLFSPQISFAKDIRPIAFRLWKTLGRQDIIVLGEVSNLLDKKKYEEALQKVELFYKNSEDKGDENNPFMVERTDLKDAIRNIILWRKYSDEEYSKNLQFHDISRFVNDNKFYPNIKDITKVAQQTIVGEKIPYHLSAQYFKSNPADNLDTKLHLLDSKQDYLLRFQGDEKEKDGIAKEIQKNIIAIWINENFNEKQEAEFLEKYNAQLTEEDHINRINRLLWDSKFEEGKRIMSFVNDDHQKLFEAIIKIRALPKYINNIILFVPRKLRSDEQLIYSRILWHKNLKEDEDAVDLLLRIVDMKYPDKWWNLRHFYSRELLKSKDYKYAYAIAKNHNLAINDQKFWEASWLAGWIALRFLNNPQNALSHFQTLYNNVKQPVTMARAAYWLGMTYEALDEKNKAISWYKISTNYPVYFYGQLGIHKYRELDSLNVQSDIILPKPPEIRVGDARKISSSTDSQVAYLLALMGDKKNATQIFEYIIKNAETDGQIAVIMRIVNEVGDIEMDVKLSRVAERKNVFFIKDKFQIIKNVANDEYAPLVHAIIKQESGFAPTALSHVGAVGFMQIMPETAKTIAKEVGVPYSKKKLATDINYNIKLGSYYIKQMIMRFEGSEMLAIASYNACPHSTARWIQEFYDPRDEKDLDKVVDWIELITYSETRNYVQRIMENLIVYKYLMSRSNYDEVK